MRGFSGILGLALLASAFGCTTGESVGQYEAALRQANTCDDVLEAIQEDAISKVELELKTFIEQDYYGWGEPVALDRGGQEFAGSGGTGGVAAPAADDGANGDAGAPSGFSDTNRQVADVDEADIVKVGREGTKLYIIRGNGFHEFDSWPAAQTSKVSDVEIVGYPIEMFVEGDRAVVFSSVHQGVEGLDDGNLCGRYPGGPEPAIADIDGYYGCGRPFVKVTVIDITSAPHEVLREIYVDGWYTSSRRHDGIVRAVVQTSMQQPASVPYIYDAIYGGGTYPQSREQEVERAIAWAAAAKAAIRQTTLDEWLPVWGERIDGEIQQQPHQCADFYSPSAGMTNYGMTQIVGFDIDGEGVPAIASILGAAERVYASRDALVLAQPDWSWFERDRDSNRTAVHQFEVSPDEARTIYQGSGFVPGVIHDQFSMDEHEGVIRIATTRTTWHHQSGDAITPNNWVPPTTDNVMTTLQLDGDALALLGQVDGLAEGETITSARFVGDIGYMVTFLQIDPLFAVDLSNPSAPVVLGELKIPGFSDYLHPLGADHLLTIGRDVDELTGFDNGTALQIFDVSDPKNPILAHKALVGQGYSEANHEHKAFNFYAGDEPTRGVLAFPFVSYEVDFASTLELWDIDALAAENGIVRRGAVDHSDLVLEDCGTPYPVDEFYLYCGYEPQITRGVFIDEYIYSISHGGVRVHNLADLGTPVATATY